MAEEEAKPAAATGLERVREILLGGILVELDRRLSKLEHYITTRSSDVQHDARQRTDVLEAHVKKEVDAVAARATRDSADINNLLREARHEQRDSFVQLEQRISRIEERLEAQVARIERDTREQLLAATKNFFEELAQLRGQLRAESAREEEEEGEAGAEGTEHFARDAH
jgi:hypothetical protein